MMQPLRATLTLGLMLLVAGASAHAQPSSLAATDSVRSGNGSFFLGQTAGALFVYAPSVAALTADGKTAGPLALGTALTAIAVANWVEGSRTITRSQATLATDGLFRGPLTALLLRDAFRFRPPRPACCGVSDPQSDRLGASLALMSAIGGTMLGYHSGARINEADAAGAVFGANVSGLLAAGIAGAAGEWTDDHRRMELLSVATASLAGYPLGVLYVRSSNYVVTPGDASAVLTTALLGALASSVALPSRGANERDVFATLTAGFLAGLVGGDRLIARRRDLTSAQANRIRYLAIAGGVAGLLLTRDVQHGIGSRAVVSLGSLLGAFAAMK